MGYFLCIDCGLTKIKTILINKSGDVVCEEKNDTPLKNDMIDVGVIKKLLVKSIKNIVDSGILKNKKILAVTASGHGNGLYIIEKNGFYPYGYSSMFSQSIKYTPKSEKTLPLTMQTSWSGQPLAILSYLKDKEPDVFERIEKVLFCKDMIRYILTNKVFTEYTDASAAGLLNGEKAQYDKNLLKLYNLQDFDHLLPDICKCTDIVGNVTKEFADLCGLNYDIPVVAGMFDVNSCMLGAGVVKPDKYCIISGTWGINSAVLQEALINPDITQCCNFIYPERYMAIDSAPASCGNLEWFLKNVLQKISYKEADDIVREQPYDRDLLYFPYIYKPMDICIDGGFTGLKPRHDYKDMLRAVFEGIVFDHAYRIEKLKKAGIYYKSAVLTGGAANSDVFCQMFANATGLEIQTTKHSQTGIIGGAIICSVALSVYDSIDIAIDNIVETKKIYYPQNNIYKNKLERFMMVIGR